MPLPPESGSSRLGRQHWLFPDLALSIAAITLVYCLFVFEGYRKLFRDADTGWHIRTGERILTGGGLPRDDPYSLTRRGEPWFAWEWGADAVFGWAHQRSGLAGVAALCLALIAAGVWLWFRLHWAAGGDFVVACMMIPPMLTTASLHWLARPHLLSWLFLLLTLWLAERAPRHFGWRHAAGLLLAGAAWANLHASFFLGPLVLGLYALGHWLRPRLWPAEQPDGRARFLLLAALCAAAGSLANPYGLALHGHLFGYLSNTELLARVAEFQSFNFHAEGAALVLLTYCLCWLGVGASLIVRQPGRALVCLLLLAVATRSARGLPVLALAALPLANASLSAALRQARGLAPRLRRALDAVFVYSANLRAIDRRHGGWAWMAPILLLFAAFCHLPPINAETGFSPDEFPVAAAAHVERLPAGARLFSTDKFGGYLIYRFNGARPVFFDGRSDFYGAAFMKQYIEIIEARPGWRQPFDSHNFTHALVPARSPLRAALEAAGWSALYSDSTAWLLAAPAAGTARPSSPSSTRFLPESLPGSLWTVNACS